MYISTVMKTLDTFSVPNTTRQLSILGHDQLLDSLYPTFNPFADTLTNVKNCTIIRALHPVELAFFFNNISMRSGSPFPFPPENFHLRKQNIAFLDMSF